MFAAVEANRWKEQISGTIFDAGSTLPEIVRNPNELAVEAIAHLARCR
jgi:hypothetical protein